MINILFFTVSFKNIGPSKALMELALNIDKNKFNVYYVTCDYLVENDISSSLTNACIPIFSLEMSSYFDIRGFYKLFKLINKYKIEIIHSRLIRANFYARIVGKFSKVKVIISNIVEDYTLHFNNVHSKLIGFILKSLDLASIHMSNIVVVNSTHIKATLNHYWGYRKKKIVVIQNGIRVSKFFQENEFYERFVNDFNLKQCTIIIGSVGRLVKVKGYDILIDAANSVLKKGQNLKFFIVGDGEQYEILKNKIINYGIQDSVYLLKHSENVPSLLSAFDIFIFTSLSEGMPNTVLEAMASKLPIITFDIPGIRDLVTDKYNGLVLKTRAIESLANSILELSSDFKKIKEFGANGLKRAQDSYDISFMVSRFENLYIEEYFKKKS